MPDNTLAGYLLIDGGDFLRDPRPLILVLYAVPRESGGDGSHGFVREQKVQHTRKVLDIPRAKSEPRTLDEFAVFRHIAGQDAGACAHCVEQGQRESLEVGGQNEKSSVGEQFAQYVTCDPVSEDDAVIGLAAQALRIGISVARSPSEHQFRRGMELLVGGNQEMAVLLRR